MQKEALCVLAIHASHSSALAFYFASAPAIVTAEDMLIASGQIDCAGLSERIRQMRPDIAVIEHFAPMSDHDALRSVKFTLAYGAVLGVLGALGIRIRFVKAIKWKGYFSLGPEEDAARKMAMRLWPDCVRSFERKM